MSWPAHITGRSGPFTLLGGYYRHTHPHAHPDHATSPDPETRRLAHPPGWAHAHEHRFEAPVHHHHPPGGGEGAGQ